WYRVAVAVEAAHEDEVHRRAQEPRLPRQLEAAHLWHPHVEHHEVDWALYENADGLEAITGGEGHHPWNSNGRGKGRSHLRLLISTKYEVDPVHIRPTLPCFRGSSGSRSRRWRPLTPLDWSRRAQIPGF